MLVRKSQSKQFRTVAHHALALIALVCLSRDGFSQEPALTAAAVEQSSHQPVPTVVRSQGTLSSHAGEKALLRFAIYATESSRDPLWSENQFVQLDARGEYAVYLGAGSAIGVPQNLFVAGEPRWLSVRVDGDSGSEQRQLLATVPYAMKAADAQTLAGQPAARFVTQEQLSARFAATAATLAAEAGKAVAVPPTGGGTTGYLPIWTTASALGNSALFQSGVGISAKVGIATATPATMLDVNGASTFRGRVSLSGLPATATSGVNSPILSLGASSFKAGGAAVAQNFLWQAQALGNNTASPTSRLALFFGAGVSAPAATGLSIAPNGVITFAPSQTFPGSGTGGGSITGVTAGIGLTGGGTTGKVTLTLDTTKVPLLNTANTFTKGAFFGGETVLNGSSTDWMLVATNTGAGKGSILGQAAGTSLGIEGASPGGIGVQGVSDTGFGVSAISNSNGTALRAIANGSGPSAYLSSESSTPTATVKNFAVGTAIYGSAGIGFGGYFTNNSTYQATVAATNAGNGNAGLFNNNSSSRVALAGVNSSTDINAIGTYGSVSSGKAVYGISGTGIGVYGTTSGGGGSSGVAGVGASNGNGVYGLAPSGQGVYGASQSGTGVYAISNTGAGVVGLSGGVTVSGPAYKAAIGVQGSAANSADKSVTSVGVLGTADNGVAGDFINHSDTYYTVVAYNYGSSPTHNFFRTLMAGTPNGTCGFGSGGDLTCTGQIRSVVTTASSRQVETYAVQSSENWLEDYGSGKLENGKAVIRLDPAFADAANTGVTYHVFLTPEGDAQPLFITRKTATSFEVNESANGSHSIDFSYRIVAKRRGVEEERLVDVTERLRAEIEAGRPHAKASEQTVGNEEAVAARPEAPKVQ